MSQFDAKPVRILITNKLVTSPHFSEILRLYNEEYRQRAGKVNEKKFYEDHVKPVVSGYSLPSFYQFLARFKDASGIVILEKLNNSLPMEVQPAVIPSADESSQSLQKTMLSITEAEQQGIALALNIAVDKLKTLEQDPTKISFKDAIDFLFKGMKARDSRIHAIGKVREDNREQEKMDRAFEAAQY